VEGLVVSALWKYSCVEVRKKGADKEAETQSCQQLRSYPILLGAEITFWSCSKFRSGEQNLVLPTNQLVSCWSWASP
jgi:hypothetical protein